MTLLMRCGSFTPGMLRKDAGCKRANVNSRLRSAGQRGVYGGEVGQGGDTEITEMVFLCGLRVFFACSAYDLPVPRRRAT